MNGLTLRFALGLMLLSASFSSVASASSEKIACDSRLLAKFSQAPQEGKLGLITKDVAMTPEALIAALTQGIYPHYIDDRGRPVWTSPPERGVMFFSDLRIPKTDREFIDMVFNSPEYRVTRDQAFTEVMGECAKQMRWRKLENGDRVPDGLWISPEFIRNYTKLYEMGLAHSYEVWHNGILVGGLYGTYVNGVFGGESMFHKESNVTKAAFYKLTMDLIASGHWFMDTQQAKDGTLPYKWGARTIPRKQFQSILRQAQSENLPLR